MKKIPPVLLADLQANCTTMAFLWTIEKGNGDVIRGTDHDLDITIPGDTGSPDSPSSPADKFTGTYFAIANVTAGDIVSSSDLTVDNLEVTGAFPQAPYTEINDVTVADIEAGLLDMAPVTVLICNWAQPSHGYFAVKSGYLGAITRNSDGKYTTEVRGLSQLLSQNIIRTCSATCNVVKFGDKRCRFPLATVTFNGEVTAADNPQQFTVELDLGSPRASFPFAGGILTFTSGQNKGFSREVKTDPNSTSGVISFWEAFPNTVNPSDAFTLSAGCDRQPSTCINVYDNLVHWRGPGIFIPGALAILAGPPTAAGL